MQDGYVRLEFWQIGLAAALILVNAGVSLALKLGLAKRLLVAAFRTVVQLLLVGLVLEWIFAVGHWYVVLLMVTFMTLVAAAAAVRRTDRRYPGVWLDSLISMWASSWLIAAVALLGIIEPEPWYLPQYAIPLTGMILGNTLNGISLGLDRFGDELDGKRDQVETLLALGATRWEAARTPLEQSIRTGMIPTINTMMVVGLVSLPGMMTGQLLAGANPIQAVMYQIVIMFLIAAGTALGTVSVVLLGYRRLFNADHQFLSQRIARKR